MFWRQRRPNKQKTTGKIVKIPTGKIVNIQRCREFRTLPTFRHVRSKPVQDKVAASDKDVDSKKRQGQTLARDHAVDRHASQAVRRRSYRLSLVFIGSSLSRNFRHPACPALLVNQVIIGDAFPNGTLGKIAETHPKFGYKLRFH